MDKKNKAQLEKGKELASLDSILEKHFGEEFILDFHNTLIQFPNEKVIKNSQYLIDLAPLKYYEYFIHFLHLKLEKAVLIKLFSNLGEDLYDLGQLPLAIISYRQVIKLTKGNKHHLNYYAYSLFDLGYILSEQEKWKQAIGNLNQARKIFLSIKNILGVIRCDNILGIIYAKRGYLKNAMRSFQKCLDNSNPEMDDKWIAKYENNLGNINRALGNYDNALMLFKRSLTRAERNYDIFQILQARINIAFLLHERKEIKKSLSEFDYCISLANRYKYKLILASAYSGKSAIWIELNDLSLAIQYWNISYLIYHPMNYLQVLELLYRLKGRIRLMQKRYKMAETSYLRSMEINEKIKSRWNIAENEHELGLLYIKWEKYEKASLYLQKALTKYKRINVSYRIKETDTEINNLEKYL